MREVLHTKKRFFSLLIMNLLAVGGNGQRLLENFLEAIEPVLHAGARRCAQLEAQQL